jgi:hypothetical protein
LDEHNKQSHLEDDIPANLTSEVLDERQDCDDDVGAKSWRFRLKSLIEK